MVRVRVRVRAKGLGLGLGLELELGASRTICSQAAMSVLQSKSDTYDAEGCSPDT